MRFLALFFVSLFIAAPAKADWHEASSDHFVVYADDKAKDVEEFTIMLERYHAALELVTGRKVEKPSPSNRVTIFAVGNGTKVSKLATGSSRGRVAGFYVPRAGGSRAFVQDVKTRHRETPFSMTVLLHEYAHHFMIGSSRFSMPAWLREGSAEFFASARFPEDGSVHIGMPAYHRVNEFRYARRVGVKELLDPEVSSAQDGYYAWAWALYHHLNFGEGRTGQISTYWQSLASGTDAMKAAEDAFGDLDVLQTEVNASLTKRSSTYFTLEPAILPIGEVTIRRVSEGHDKVLPLIIQSQSGVTRKEALRLLPKIQKIAKEFPADAQVQAALAEAEHDAGNYAASIAAADRAIASDPSVKNAYVQKGYSKFALAGDAEPDAMDAAYAEAMEPFSALNQLENDHPLPLIYFYRSFVQRGEEPTDLAKAALEQAANLAPFDKGLWFTTAVMQGQEGKVQLASLSLGSLASDPHGGNRAAASALVVSQLKNLPEGEPVDIPEMYKAARSALGTAEEVAEDGD